MAICIIPPETLFCANTVAPSVTEEQAALFPQSPATLWGGSLTPQAVLAGVGVTSPGLAIVAVASSRTHHPLMEAPAASAGMARLVA